MRHNRYSWKRLALTCIMRIPVLNLNALSADLLYMQAMDME